MAIDPAGVQISRCIILKAKHVDSLSDVRVELNPPSLGRYRKEVVRMQESLGSVSLWMHALGGGHHGDVKDPVVDGEWGPE